MLPPSLPLAPSSPAAPPRCPPSSARPHCPSLLSSPPPRLQPCSPPSAEGPCSVPAKGKHDRESRAGVGRGWGCMEAPSSAQARAAGAPPRPLQRAVAELPGPAVWPGQAGIPVERTRGGGGEGQRGASGRRRPRAASILLVCCCGGAGAGLSGVLLRVLAGQGVERELRLVGVAHQQVLACGCTQRAERGEQRVCKTVRIRREESKGGGGSAPAGACLWMHTTEGTQASAGERAGRCTARRACKGRKVRVGCAGGARRATRRLARRAATARARPAAWLLCLHLLAPLGTDADRSVVVGVHCMAGAGVQAGRRAGWAGRMDGRDC